MRVYRLALVPFAGTEDAVTRTPFLPTGRAVARCQTLELYADGKEAVADRRQGRKPWECCSLFHLASMCTILEVREWTGSVQSQHAHRSRRGRSKRASTDHVGRNLESLSPEDFAAPRSGGAEHGTRFYLRTVERFDFWPLNSGYPASNMLTEISSLCLSMLFQNTGKVCSTPTFRSDPVRCGVEIFSMQGILDTGRIYRSISANVA